MSCGLYGQGWNKLGVLSPSTVASTVNNSPVEYNWDKYQSREDVIDYHFKWTDEKQGK